MQVSGEAESPLTERHHIAQLPLYVAVAIELVARLAVQRPNEGSGTPGPQRIRAREHGLVTAQTSSCSGATWGRPLSGAA